MMDNLTDVAVKFWQTVVDASGDLSRWELSTNSYNCYMAIYKQDRGLLMLQNESDKRTGRLVYKNKILKNDVYVVDLLMNMFDERDVEAKQEKQGELLDGMKDVISVLSSEKKQ